MLNHIINFSLKNKLIVFLFTASVFGLGIYSLFNISIGAVPDITNNQVQVITTSRNLSTNDIEQFITYPIEIEMANLPGVKEIRSISKFGLSVVTIVFEESMGTYLPRQLIAEKIKTASEKIPKEFGTPEMGPITTGLGEIYQYTLEVKPQYKDRYSITELRTIQDWLVKRQLSGIKGVVEINTWGGYLKQYEVAINTDKLKAYNVSIAEIVEALEKNNSIAGGAYIEKINQSYFIRGEGKIENAEDIKKIVIKTNNAIPVLINDVAQINFGNANRFGAITGNGEGEKVLGQVMMLKGANSKEVIENVKNRVKEIEKTLPDGIYINGFLERSELVGKTTFTVAENLIIGCLIVIFVVVLLLGNWRSGLVVASVIPLCLLFAISLMNIFKIDANLMSLGAIDFGIIIDGAVIIVEYIAYSITQNSNKLFLLPKELQQKEIDDITKKSASKMMHSAVFGQLIILIVFIPIFSLSGVEGKMFKPMALTFSFALIGAMIFCFTYVPVVSSIFLKPRIENKKSLSKKIIQKLTNYYLPVINWALNNTKKTIIATLSLLIVSIIIFSRMGGEFIPTLDEGDFVIQPVLKTGTSLSKTIKTTTKIEQIILKNFPEVEQVISRIGAAEVPTDPMSMEESDIIVKLKPRKHWVSASNKDDLADLIKNKIEQKIPNVDIEFTQPIEMRFNELISGSRSDVAIKIYGENLDILVNKANEVEKIINKIAGASDIIIEKTEGLPQMYIKYNREEIAKYGLNISDINEVISLGFAGKTVGTVFEGEKRFDMVIRLQKENRNDLDDIKNLYISTPNGNQIPLRELAEIDYATAPAKISRDNTKRRIVIGINIRNRDLQSVVKDIQNKIEKKIKLPDGYTISYGGQFENLQSAKNRLLFAVPIALILIFIMLHFAFGSLNYAIMIFSAIPLSAVGGVLLLWMRGLPFSISAGVGFIALFGIAVLNGIVLIEHFKELKNQNFSSINQLIIKGTTDRLRPVLLTAAAAALGFLPMAISSSAGAEVQRPLATVVIGGLITATLLTMIVLPVLFKLFNEKKFSKKLFNKNKVPLIILMFLLFNFSANAQNNKELDSIIAYGLKNNKDYKAAMQNAEKAKQEVKTALDIDKTNIYYAYDQNNLALNNMPLKVFGVQQSFKFPTVYTNLKKNYNLNADYEQIATHIVKNNLVKEITISYYKIVYWQNKEKLYKNLDSLYQNFSKASSRRFELGESNYLEKITSLAKAQQIQYKLKEIEKSKLAEYENLYGLTQDNTKKVTVESNTLSLVLPLLNVDNYFEQYWNKNSEILNQQIKVEKSLILPNINVEYFQGKNNKLTQSLYGFQVGLSVPIFFTANAAKIKVAKLNKEIWETQKSSNLIFLDSKRKQLQNINLQHLQAIEYYNKYGENLAKEIIKVANYSFKHGEIDFFQYIQSLENASSIQEDYLNALIEYNVSQIQLNYLDIK